MKGMIELYSKDKFYPGTNDVVFKILFSKNIQYLWSFFTAFLDIDESEFYDLRVLNPEIPNQYVKDKFCRLDLYVSTSRRELLVEMQNFSQDYFGERSLYYWSGMFKGVLDKGDGYDNIPASVTLGILNFILFNEEEAKEIYHSRFRLYEETRRTLLTDKLDMHFIELPKVKPLADHETDLKKLWAHLLMASTKEDFDMIQQRTSSPIILNAIKTIAEINADDNTRALLLEREKAMRDEITMLRSAEKKGRDEMIAKFRAAGVSEEMIAAALSM